MCALRGFVPGRVFSDRTTRRHGPARPPPDWVGLAGLGVTHAIVFVPDGRYYVSVYGSQVMALTVSADHRVTDLCRSEGLGANVVSASLAFNPADAYAIKQYVSAAVLCFDDRLGPPLSARDNGRILLLEPDVNGQCLSLSQTVISGLPTSNHDHSVSGLGFA